MTSYSKADYLVTMTGLLPDNATQQISPEDLRTVLTDLVDSTANFLVGVNINTANFSTPSTRTTRGGELAINNLGSPGRTSVDNTALGYYALGGNYTGSNDTALGSYALSCNLYGNDNTAVGYRALAGNINGSGNVGIGNNTLLSNKNGDFNIAIGHGAGYYIGNNQSDLASNSYKLYVASHPMDSGALCNIQTNSGTAPLLYGDLLTLQLGIGVKTLHDFGALQTSGDVSPWLNDTYHLGHPSYNWNSAFLSSGLAFPDSGNFYIAMNTPKDQEQYPDQYTQTQVFVITSGTKFGIGTATPSGDQGMVTVAGSVVPKLDSIYALGHPSLRWDGYFNDVIISGQATINDLQYNTINSCVYDCVTLHLASSGLCGDGSPGPCGYLSDEGIDGGGLEIHSSGSDYRRDYQFIYRFPDTSLTCLEVDDNYARSRWYTNISLQIESGRHLQTDRVIGRDKLSLVSQSGCFGLFIRPNGPSGNKVYLSQENYISQNYTYTADVNFFGASGNSDDFVVSYSSPESGVLVAQNFATRVSGGMVGFGLEHHDDAGYLVDGAPKDRFAIRRYNGQGNISEPLVITRTNNRVGITDKLYASGSDPVLPLTILNVQTQSDHETRLSSDGLSTTKLSLLSNGNTRASGLEFMYDASTEFSDISTIRGGVEIGIVSMTPSGFVGIGHTHSGYARPFIANAPLTVYHNGSLSGTVALKEQAANPNVTADFGKLFVKPKIVGATQTQSLYFLDDGNNEFNIVRSPNDTSDNLVYSDASRNTYAGINCPVSRPTLLATDNTAYGYNALSGITAGDMNTVMGANAGQYITSGNSNTIIGEYAFSSGNGYYNTIVGDRNLAVTTVGNNNVIIGHKNLVNNTSIIKNSIIIGTGIAQTGALPDFTLAIGHGSTPIISGTMGPTTADKNIVFQESQVSVAAEYNYQRLILNNERVTTAFIGDATLRNVSNIEIQDNTLSSYDSSGNFAGNTNGAFTLDFADQSGIKSTLMSFLYDASPMATGSVSWTAPSTPRPYAELRGDLRLVGAVRFADGSVLDSSLGTVIQAGTGLRRVDSGSSTMHLDYSGLIDAENINSPISTSGSYLSIAVASGTGLPVGKISVQGLADLVGSGFASVSTNCNHIFSNAEASVNTAKNSNSIFVGCNVAVGATGWKHSVMIGSEAGYGATTPNGGLSTDIAAIFLGYRAGYNADNLENSIFIGTNAGNAATTASDSIFIGSSAGLQSSMNNSIGIGEHALRGAGGVETGQNNIEIITGKNDSDRLMYGSGTLSDRLNIQNVIAGNTAKQLISIGDAILEPDAPLSVRKDDTIPGHSGASYVQTWHCNDSLVAYVDCNGNFSGNGSVVEGVMVDQVLAPSVMSSPTSGILATRDGDWLFDGNVYIVNRDPTLNIHAGAYVKATKVNGTYRPDWVSCSGA